MKTKNLTQKEINDIIIQGLDKYLVHPKSNGKYDLIEWSDFMNDEGALDTDEDEDEDEEEGEADDEPKPVKRKKKKEAPTARDKEIAKLKKQIKDLQEELATYKKLLHD